MLQVGDLLLPTKSEGQWEQAGRDGACVLAVRDVVCGEVHEVHQQECLHPDCDLWLLVLQGGTLCVLSDLA